MLELPENEYPIHSEEVEAKIATLCRQYANEKVRELGEEIKGKGSNKFDGGLYDTVSEAWINYRETDGVWTGNYSAMFTPIYGPLGASTTTCSACSLAYRRGVFSFESPKHNR